MFVILPVRHSIVNVGDLSPHQHQELEAWAKQWTTPNNLDAACGPTAEMARLVFEAQPFRIPVGFDAQVVKKHLLIVVQVREFSADGKEIAVKRRHIEVRLTNVQ